MEWQTDQLSKINSDIWFLGPENVVLDTKIIILCALILKVIAQNLFLKNGGKHNTPMFGKHTDC